VAYFKEGRPVKGKNEFRHEWIGAKWYFASAASRDEFAKNSENTLRNSAAIAPGRSDTATRQY
jgi:YHS domain-containing protein